MSRRSARLVTGGYYQSDEDSDSSTVTNVSYRESPVRVFKKKAGNRKAASRTSSRASSNVSLADAESPATADQNDATQQTVVSVPFVATTSATPRPALTPARSRSQTPSRSQADVPKESRAAGLYGSSRPGGLNNAPHAQEINQNSIESGYSSSEGLYQRPTSAKSDGTCSTGHRTEYLSPASPTPNKPLAEVAQARIKLLTDLANESLGPGGKKAACLLLLLLIILLSIWFLFPWLASLMPRRTVLKTQTQAEPRKPPVVPSLPLSPPPPPPNTRPLIATVDPAMVSAAVEKKMQGLLEDILLKQENLHSQLEERMQLDMQGVRARMEAADTDSRLRLEKEVAALRTQLEQYQTHSHTASDSLSHRLGVVEEDNVKLSEELLSIQSSPPPPAPTPDPVIMPAHSQLTPELQQAMEKWLLDRIKEQDMNGALGKESSTETCWERPMADKMADFALETQGASVISTKCSETYRIRSACVTLFGFPLWYPSESPRTVIQGYPVLLPGKCWAFHGVQGILVLSLSHPVRITHVTLDHLPRCNSPTGRIDSAPKDFQVYGMINDTEEGALLGQFTYNEDGESTQTFELPDPTNVVYRFVELRVLSNWGHMEYTCLYRFRIHGTIAST